jgi:GGDEF domain-containing protein
MHQEKSARTYDDPTLARIASLVKPVPVFEHSTPCFQVAARMPETAYSEHAVLLDGRRYLGLVHRTDVDRFCQVADGAAPIGAVRIQQGSLISCDMSLAEALELASSRHEDQMGQPLIVQSEGSVVGMVTMRDLLQTAATSRRRMPSHVASLTGLPSRVQADQWVDQRIRAGAPSNVAFIDLRNFDAFNASHGFEQGDAMLLRLVGLIRALVVANDDEGTFFAHLGEDRFMVATSREMGGDLQQLVDEFADCRSAFFTAEDIRGATFTGPLRPDGDDKYALTTLRIIYLQRPLQQISGPRELHELAKSLRLADGEGRLGLDDLIRDRRSDRLIQRRSA